MSLSGKTESKHPLNTNFPFPLPHHGAHHSTLSLWIWPRWAPHISGILQYLSFCDSFILLLNVFSVHLYCSMCQYTFPFEGRITFLCRRRLHCLPLLWFRTKLVNGLWGTVADLPLGGSVWSEEVDHCVPDPEKVYFPFWLLSWSFASSPPYCKQLFLRHASAPCYLALSQPTKHGLR